MEMDPTSIDFFRHDKFRVRHIGMYYLTTKERIDLTQDALKSSNA